MDAFDALVDPVPSRPFSFPPPSPSSPPPPPSPSPSSHVVVPFINLPDELLRKISEIAVVSDYRTANNLMIVSKWVRAWLIDTYYDTVVVATPAQLRTLETQPDRLRAKIRSLWIGLPLQRLEHGHVFESLDRLPNITRLALLQVPTYRYSLSWNRPRCVEQLLHPDVRLREFVFSNVPRESYRQEYFPSMALSSPVFSTITHLRLGYACKDVVDQLTSDTPTLPLLTHLSFNAYAYTEYIQSHHDRLEIVIPVEVYSRILEAPSRVNLQMLVLVVDCDMEGHVLELLALRLPRLVVLRKRKRYTRRREWLATSEGRSRFWERATRDGVSQC